MGWQLLPTPTNQRSLEPGCLPFRPNSIIQSFLASIHFQLPLYLLFYMFSSWLFLYANRSHIRPMSTIFYLSFVPVSIPRILPPSQRKLTILSSTSHCIYHTLCSSRLENGGRVTRIGYWRYSSFPSWLFFTSLFSVYFGFGSVSSLSPGSLQTNLIFFFFFTPMKVHCWPTYDQPTIPS